MVRYKLSELTINTFFSYECSNFQNISKPTILQTRYTEPNCFSLHNFKLEARIVLEKIILRKGEILEQVSFQLDIN